MVTLAGKVISLDGYIISEKSNVFLTQSFYGSLLPFFDLDDGHHELSLNKELHEDSSTFSNCSKQGEFKVTRGMHISLIVQFQNCMIYYSKCVVLVWMDALSETTSLFLFFCSYYLV